MKRIIFFLLAIMFSLAPYAQKTVHKKPMKKTAVANRKHQAQRKPAARRAKAPTKAERRAATYSNASIRGLQGQRADIQRRIREQEQALRKNKADVKKRLEDLMALNGEIDQSQKKIEGIEKDIHHIDGNIGILQAQLKTLQQQLQDRKNKYIRSMRYMSRHHTVQDKLMFIFSAKNLTQMYRRLSFIRQYSSYQKVQGEAVKAKQLQVNDKHKQLQNVKGHKNTLLYKGKQEKTVLEGKQTQQQEMVHGLQKQQKTIQAVIADQRQKDAAINAQIDRLIQQEVAKARARAAAEAKRKAAAAAAAKKRAEELARKKAAAEQLQGRMHVVLLRLRLVRQLQRLQEERLPRRLVLLPRLLERRRKKLQPRLRRRLKQRRRLRPVLLPKLPSVLPQNRRLVKLLPNRRLRRRKLTARLLS